MNILSQDIKYLKGVGPARASLLHSELGIRTVEDLLWHFPYKYVDRSEIHTIRSLRDDMPYVQLRGRVLDIAIDGAGSKRRLVASFTDGTGYIDLVWFNGIKHMERSLRVDRTYLILGKPSAYGNRFSIIHPEMDEERPEGKSVGDAAARPVLAPHYHTTERMKRSAMSSRQISELMRTALTAVGDGLPETLPSYLVARHRLSPLLAAMRVIHFPPSSDVLPDARRRLKFEELFYLQLHILSTTRARRSVTAGLVFAKVDELFLRFYHERLPFALTEAQKRVIREIRRDLGSGRQMNRLLQGDVGSGKTMVSLMTSLIAIDNGYQACLMAPTEILAEQHLATLRHQLGDLPVRVELLTGAVTGGERRRVLEGVRDGSVHLLVGTHALIEPGVVFHNLGLAIIDEQHRFGVKQRARLWEKNVSPPHILVMTATPIPRTLAMTVYGDLDVSVIDELPPGRKPVHTLHYTAVDAAKLYDGIRRELIHGHQVYVVYPLIEENERLTLQDLENGYNTLTNIFPDYVVGRVHGRMKPAEKDAVMQAFSAGHINILLSTTVIEVGVNVPSATVMVIQNAERFGLSQLHQLRGRVGRGGDRSYCILVTGDRLAQPSLRRMQIMVETTDGFVIADEDMKLRGPGDLQGTAQSGLPFTMKIASLTADADLMAEARKAAAEVLEQDPDRTLPSLAVVWQRLRHLAREKTDFSAIS